MIDTSYIICTTERALLVPESFYESVVQFTNKTQIQRCAAPKLWDNDTDLSKMGVRVNYYNSAGKYIGFTEAKNVATENVDGIAYITFDWLIEEKMTKKYGPFYFAFCAVLTDADGAEIKHWQSAKSVQCIIRESVEPGGDHEIEPSMTQKVLGEIGLIKETLSYKVGYAEQSGGVLKMYSDASKSKLIASIILPSGGSGGSLTEEQIASAVQNYLANHPIPGDGNTHYTFELIGNQLIITPDDGYPQTLILPSGGSGSQVEVLPILNEGTKIGAIMVDGVQKNFYAPEPYNDSAIVGDLAKKYVKPTTGIPKTDLASTVQESLGKADTALQSVPDTYATKDWVQGQIPTTIVTVRPTYANGIKVAEVNGIAIYVPEQASYTNGDEVDY